MIPKLSWTHYIQKLSIKNENERNYYINQVILNNLSVRELKREIQNKAFDRLSYADKEHIEIISDDNIIRVIYPEHEHFIYIFQLLPQCGNN